MFCKDEIVELEKDNPKFIFPFPPYDIQTKFMKELYYTIENRKLGIFESPTGTGKSLSISCGALQWLRDSNQKCMNNLKSRISDLKLQLSCTKDTDNWLQEEYEKIQKNQLLVSLELKLDKMKQKEDQFFELQKKVSRYKTNMHKIENLFKKTDKNNEDCESKRDYEEKIDTEDQDIILDECENNGNQSDEEEISVENNTDGIVKIYVSSRTHTQLSQFVGEIKRTIFKDNIRVVTLASRQHYCINSDVTRLKNVNLINERCLDMQKSKTKSTSVDEEGKVLKKTKTKSCTACPFNNQNNITMLKEHLLVEIMDVEEIVKCGKRLKACPYYASRMALDDAEIVLISHAGIVSAGARSGLSLQLADNVVILDEAHGLAAALENAHSAPVSLKQLSSVKTYLGFYIDKYRVRFSSNNLLRLNQLNFIVGKLLGTVNPKTASDEKKYESKIYTLEEFVIMADIGHLHLQPLVEFCRNTRLAPKLHGFSRRYSQKVLEEGDRNVTDNKKTSFKEFLTSMSKKKNQQSESPAEKNLEVNTQEHSARSEPSAGSGLYAILDFIEMLCARSDNGRVLVHVGESAQLKYLLLDPAEHFKEVVDQCRSVIVAGGTMEPVNEFTTLLTNNGPEVERINVVKCDHVVPPDNVLGVCLSKGPSNIRLNFSYENRTSKELLSEVGRVLRNVCSVVPQGVVCFLPSYSYEQTLYDHLKNNNIIDSISKKKKIFREPKSASEVDQVLQKYAVAAKNKVAGEINGALLLSVVGGKLSEGLNFSDDLGRCVIVIGMPYPNVKSPELKEKMNYLNKSSPGSGQVYYENLCMKAVNQCVGRAVRHINDYACILLVDERYSRPQTISALPSFVQKSLTSNCTFGQTVGKIAKFFAQQKEKHINQEKQA